MDLDDPDTIVLDNGTHKVRAGIAGNDAPTFIVPNVVAWPKTPPLVLARGGRGRKQKHRCYVGEEAVSLAGVLTLRHPMERGVVTDWEGMERVWRHLFVDKLRIKPAEHQVIVSEVPLNPKQNRIQMAKVVFETFGFLALHVQLSCVMRLYAAGRTTGIMVDCGECASYVMPIYEGLLLPDAIRCMPLGGRDLTECLLDLLVKKRGYPSKSMADREGVRAIKEKLSYVAIDFAAACEVMASQGSEAEEETYELPDGSEIMLGSERFHCMEPLFQPSLLLDEGRVGEGGAGPGIHELLLQSVMRCPIDCRADMFANLVLDGGSTTSKGFRERLEREVKEACVPRPRGRLRVVHTERHGVWLGGSIIGSLRSAQPCFMSKAEYDRSGPGALHVHGPVFS